MLFVLHWKFYYCIYSSKFLGIGATMFSKNEISYRSDTAMRIHEDEIVTWIMIIDDRGMEIGWCKAEDLSLK